ncbi:hypothetical protein HA402_000536 [Bradysia odoriphaga]|nr:hypothetical protein HA402_000536 [Bradysia odoriphaga]
MMKIIFILSMTWAVAKANVSAHNPFYCFATDPIRPQNQMFATKVAYEAVRGNGFINPAISTCTPSKLFIYGRHGSRLPSSSDTLRMINIHESLKARVIENYEAGRTQLCQQDMENIRNWTINPNITVGRNSELVETGWNEWKGIGQRFRDAFPTILSLPYNQSLFLFRATDRQRTAASLQGFADGVFGEWQNVQFEPITDPDLLLRPNDDCPLYDAVRNNFIEMDAFESGPEYAEMLDQVNRKLGFFGANQLNSRDVRTVWDFCKFEQGWDPATPSPWCAAFSIANHAVMDYLEDLEYYYGMGYGGDVPLFANMNCHITQEMLRFLQSSDPLEHIARFYNSHSRPLQLFLVTLGLFDGDSPLTRHNFAQQTFRQWRSSYIAPMASNLSIVRFE